MKVDMASTSQMLLIVVMIVATASASHADQRDVARSRKPDGHKVDGIQQLSDHPEAELVEEPGSEADLIVPPSRTSHETVSHGPVVKQAHGDDSVVRHRDKAAFNEQSAHRAPHQAAEHHTNNWVFSLQPNGDISNHAEDKEQGDSSAVVRHREGEHKAAFELSALGASAHHIFRDHDDHHNVGARVHNRRSSFLNDVVRKISDHHSAGSGHGTKNVTPKEDEHHRKSWVFHLQSNGEVHNAEETEDVVRHRDKGAFELSAHGQVEHAVIQDVDAHPAGSHNPKFVKDVVEKVDAKRAPDAAGRDDSDVAQKAAEHHHPKNKAPSSERIYVDEPDATSDVVRHREKGQSLFEVSALAAHKMVNDEDGQPHAHAVEASVNATK